jgi:hypothetical protein
MTRVYARWPVLQEPRPYAYRIVTNLVRTAGGPNSRRGHGGSAGRRADHSRTRQRHLRRRPPAAPGPARRGGAALLRGHARERDRQGASPPVGDGQAPTARCPSGSGRCADGGAPMSELPELPRRSRDGVRCRQGGWSARLPWAAGGGAASWPAPEPAAPLASSCSRDSHRPAPAATTACSSRHLAVSRARSRPSRGSPSPSRSPSRSRCPPRRRDPIPKSQGRLRRRPPRGAGAPRTASRRRVRATCPSACARAGGRAPAVPRADRRERGGQPCLPAHQGVHRCVRVRRWRQRTRRAAGHAGHRLRRRRLLRTDQRQRHRLRVRQRARRPSWSSCKAATRSSASPPRCGTSRGRTNAGCGRAAASSGGRPGTA